MNKYKQALVLIMLVILSWVDLSAQLLQEDVIYHKNGSVVRGNIMIQSEDSLKIETNCNSIFVFAVKDLIGITQEIPKKVKTSKRNTFTVENNNGFYSYSTIGLLTGNSEVTDDFTFSFHTNFGYEFNHLVGVGIGVGIENLKTEILPIYASFKSHLLNKPNSPFVSLSIGYSFPLSETKKNENKEFTYEGGLNLGFDIGISSFRTNNYAFTITAGYRYQVINETSDLYYYYWYQEAQEKNTYEFNKVSIRIGFLFR